MKLKLDDKTRKFIEIEVELNGEKHKLKYFDKNTKQIKALKEASKKALKESNYDEVEVLGEAQFFENLQGDQSVIDSIVEFYEENGNIYDFVNQCDEALGKLNKRG